MSEFGDAVNQSAHQYISWDPNSGICSFCFINAVAEFRSTIIGTRSIIESKLSTSELNSFLPLMILLILITFIKYKGMS